MRGISSRNGGALALLVVGILGFVFFSKRRTTPDADTEKVILSPPVPAGVEVETELKVSADGEELFKRLLWRPVSSEDKILNAESRNWENEVDVIRAWQGFLEIEPSEALQEYLEKNPFRLNASDGLGDGELKQHAPDWLPELSDRKRYQIQASQDGMLVIARDVQKKRIFILGQGKGFRVNR